MAFDGDGRMMRAYVPGIVDADFTAGPEGAMQVSQAADGNVPDAPNAVTDCIGAYVVTACASPERTRLFRIAACEPMPGGIGLSPGSGPIAGGFTPPVLAALSPDVLDGGTGFPPIPPVIVPGGEGSGGGSEPPEPPIIPPKAPEPPGPPPVPVPLPTAGFLLIAALGGLGLMSRRG